MYQAIVERYSGFGGKTQEYRLVPGEFNTYEEARNAGDTLINEIVDFYKLSGFSVVVLENGVSVE